MIKFFLASSTLAATGLLSARSALAAIWNKTGFESKTAAEALKSLGVAGATASRDIQITAPEIAEIGRAHV